MDLTILNQNADFWDSLSEDADNKLYELGGQIYKADSDPTDKTLWIRVIANSDGTFKDPIITGYSTDEADKYKPNCGVWDSGSTYQNKDNAGLNAVFNQYGLLLKNSDGTFDFNTLKAIDLTVIPESDFRYTLNEAGDCIKDMAVQPFTNYQVTEGTLPYKVTEGNIKVIKTF